MNIVKETRDGGTALIKVTVGEKDYGETVEKTLRDYRRKANVPGFRPGMVPMGMINKMYHRGAVAEEAYKVASKACFDWIEQEKIDYVGDVMPADEQAPMDFDNDKDHEFVFEIGLAPQVAIELGPKDKITRYTIEADGAMLEGYRTNFMRKYGRLVDADAVVKDEALSATLDNGAINIADAYVGLVSMDDAQRKPFIGKKTGDTMQVDINDLYPTPSQRAAVLQVKEDELDTIDPKFTLTITAVRRFAEPELNEEFFKMAFPDGSVTDAAALETYIAEQIARETSRESQYLFSVAMRRMLLGKADMPMPGEFLKRWLLAVNEGKYTMEQIEADFPQFLDMMRWNLVQKYYAEKLDIQVTEDEAKAEAKEYAAAQFAQYGMMNVPDDMLGNYAERILTNKDEARKIFDRLYESKVVEALAPMVGVTEKRVSAEQFGKIAEAELK